MKIMKRYSLILLLAGIAFLLPVSCVREELVQDELTGRELILDIGVEGMATRAAGDPWPDVTALKEDAVDVIDIYFSGNFTSGGSTAEGIKHYRRTSANQTSDGKWKVLEDWRSEGFIEGNSYKVFVVANSKRIKRTLSGVDDYTGSINDLSLSGISTLAGLQAALKDVVEYDFDPTASNGEGGHKPYWGEFDDDNLNPEWLDLHKKYIETPQVSTLTKQQKRFYTNDKSFLMDGVGTISSLGTSNSTPTVTLYRAAAKIMLEVEFDNDFLTQFDKLPVGAPAWEFVNFAFSTPVFDTNRSSTETTNYWGGTAGAPYDWNAIFTAGALMMTRSQDDLLQYGPAPSGNEETGYKFYLNTYSYPLEWGSASGDTGAPGIIVSVNYKKNAGDSDLFQYYKIPVVDPSPTGADPLTSLDRNKVYKITATISSEGGNLLTDAYEVKCNFDILDWDWGLGSTAGSPVDGTENMYFNVSPTEIVLRGDDLQSAVIKIVKPDNKNIGLRYFNMTSAQLEEPFYQGTDTTTVQYTFTNNVAQNAAAPYYFNYKGEKRKVFTRTLERGGVTYGTTGYIQNKFTRSQYGDKLTVESYALPNRGIKYMKIRVNLDVPNWKAKKLYQDIIIRHYPTDYLTSIQGEWASRISAASVLDPNDPYYKAHNDANKGPEEYALGTEYTHFREVFIENGGDPNATGTTVTSNRDEYETGQSARYPNDFTYTLVSSTITEYVNNQAADNPDPLYVKNEESYSHYFHNDSNGGTEIASGNRTTAYGSEASAYYNSSDGYYYWGSGTATSTEKIVTLSDKAESVGTNESNYATGFPFGYEYDYYTFSYVRGQRTYNGWTDRYNWTGTFTFYKYPEHHRANNYRKPQYSCKEFSFSGYVLNTLSTANLTSTEQANVGRRAYRWVNLGSGYDFGQTRTNVRTNSFGSQNTNSEKPFVAKHMSNSVVYSVNLNNSNVVSNLSAKTAYNNHMFIIRLSETSSKFAIGHAVLDNHGLSQDNVVAPALMIASQLGATSDIPSIHADGPNSTTYYTSGSAGTTHFFHGVDYVTSAQELYYWEARHCTTYLEVGKEGVWEASGKSRYYSNWRLPTRAEIDLIIGYQGYATSRSNNSIPSELSDTAIIDGFVINGDDRVINPVLTGQFYRALDQSEATVNFPLADGTHTVRCVRELTLKELEYLENL